MAHPSRLGKPQSRPRPHLARPRRRHGRGLLRADHWLGPPRRRAPTSGAGHARYPMPIILLARLAVDGRYQGQRLGARLLAEALRRAVAASDAAAARVVVVDASMTARSRSIDVGGSSTHPTTLAASTARSPTSAPASPTRPPDSACAAFRASAPHSAGYRVAPIAVGPSDIERALDPTIGRRDRHGTRRAIRSLVSVRDRTRRLDRPDVPPEVQRGLPRALRWESRVSIPTSHPPTRDATDSSIDPTRSPCRHR